MRSLPHFQGQWDVPVLAGRCREGRGGGGRHTYPLQTVTQHSCSHSSPPTRSQGGIPPCVISKGRGQRQPGIWCLQFFSDKWHVSTERGGDGKAVVSNHSPLPAPSGRIILLYADELITVSSIWLLYKKKNASSSHCVNSHPRAHRFTTREYYYLKTSF